MNTLQKKALKKWIGEAFKQGNDDKSIILKNILDACEKEYTEDNYYTRISAIVAWLLQADETFQKKAKTESDRRFIDSIKSVLCAAVDDAVRGF